MPTWDTKECTVTVGGVPIEGWADGTILSVVYNGVKYTNKVGANGEAVRSRGNDNSAKITFTLLRTSLSNGLLNGWMKADDATNQGRFPLCILHVPTGESHAGIAWVEKDPGTEHAVEAANRQWSLESPNLVSNYIGSVDPF